MTKCYRFVRHTKIWKYDLNSLWQVFTRCQAMFDVLHLLKRHPCTSTADDELMDWRDQVTTCHDLYGSHVSLLIRSKCNHLVRVTLRSVCVCTNLTPFQKGLLLKTSHCYQAWARYSRVRSDCVLSQVKLVEFAPHLRENWFWTRPLSEKWQASLCIRNKFPSSTCRNMICKRHYDKLIWTHRICFRNHKWK